MGKYRSSIFSSDTLKLASVPKTWFYSLLLSATIVLLCELAAQSLLEPTGRFPDYWNREAAIKFEWYRRVVQAGQTPDVLIIGDSTAARNYVPEEIAHS